MTTQKTQTQKAFRSSLIVIGLIVFAILSILFTKGTKMQSSGLLVGLPILGSGIISIVGVIQTIKAFKDQKSTKFYIALIINSLVLTLFILAIIANIMDVANAVSPK